MTWRFALPSEPGESRGWRFASLRGESMGWRHPLLAVWGALVLANFLTAAPYPRGHESRPAALQRTLATAGADHAPPVPARWAGFPANWARHAASAGLAAVIVAALSGWGSALAPFLRSGSLGLPGMAWAVGLAAGGLAALALGFTGLIYPFCLWGPGLMGLGWWVRGRTRGGAAPEARGAPPVPLWLLCGEWLAAGTWMLAALTPEPGIDAYVYHLRLPFYYQLHHRVYTVWHHIHGHVPQIWEMQLMAVPPGLAAGVAQCLSAFTVVPAWRLVVRLGGGGVPARSAALLLLASPLVIGIGASAYTDVPLVWLGLAAYAAVAGRAATPARRFASGLLLGTACSLKYAAFPIVAAQAAWLGRESWRRGRWAWPLATLAGGLLVFWPWIGWNFLAAGNPFDPFLGRWFPHAMPALPFAERLSASVFRRSGRDILASVWNGYVACEPFLFVSPWMLMAAPSLLWAGRDAWPRGAGLWLGVYLAVWCWMIADERFGLAAAAVLTACLAAGGGVRLSRAGCLLLLAVNLGGAACQEFIPWPRLRTAIGLESRAAFERASIPPSPEYADAAAWLNEHAGRRDRVLLVSESRTHLLEREAIADHVIDYPTRLSHVLNRTVPSPARVAARFRQLGIRWVLYLPGRCAVRLGEMRDLLEFTPATARAWEGFWVPRAERCWAGGEAMVYRLRSAPRAVRGVPDLPGVQDVVFFAVSETFRTAGPERALAELRRYAAGYPEVGAIRRQLGEALRAMRRDDAGQAEAAGHLAFAASLESARGR